MTKPDLGLKRDCPSCGIRYYDLNKSPAICPKCGASAVVPAKTKAAPAPVVAAVAAPVKDPVAATADPDAKSDDDDAEDFDAADDPLIDDDDDDDDVEIFDPAQVEKE